MIEARGLVKHYRSTKGIYLTTNAYPWHENGFAGAQIYALSKAQLAAGAANVTMQHIDTSGMVNAPSDAGSTQPGFTLWPAQSPGSSQFNLANNGTEYFRSSYAADEAQHPVTGTPGTRSSNQLTRVVADEHPVAEHGEPGGQPHQQDPDRRPVRRPAQAAAARLGYRPDSNDTRMQQVMYANGKLWGALDTALNPGGGPASPGTS